MQLYMSWYIRSFFGFTFLNILYFFKYSCTNIFHRRNLYTFYWLDGRRHDIERIGKQFHGSATCPSAIFLIHLSVPESICSCFIQIFILITSSFVNRLFLNPSFTCHTLTSHKPAVLTVYKKLIHKHWSPAMYNNKHSAFFLPDITNIWYGIKILHDGSILCFPSIHKLRNVCCILCYEQSKWCHWIYVVYLSVWLNQRNEESKVWHLKVYQETKTQPAYYWIRNSIMLHSWVQSLRHCLITTLSFQRKGYLSQLIWCIHTCFKRRLLNQFLIMN